MSVIDRLSIIELYFYLDQIRLIQPNTQVCGHLPLLPEQCFRAGTTPNLTVRLPSECSATYNFQHLKCKDHTEAGQYCLLPN